MEPFYAYAARTTDNNSTSTPMQAHVPNHDELQSDSNL